MSVEQPFGPTPTPAWARSEPAGYPQAPEPDPAVDESAVDESAVGEATTGGLEVDTVGPQVETSDVVAASDGVDAVDHHDIVVDVDLPVAERVRRQAGALDGLADLPLSEHARRYDEVHAELQAALTEIDGESS